MLEYNQALMSALEMLWDYEAEKWNESSGDKMGGPVFYNIHFDENLGMFLIPCWLSCDVTYTGGFADNDSCVPYTVEIPLEQVVEYMKENYGYE